MSSILFGLHQTPVLACERETTRVTMTKTPDASVGLFGPRRRKEMVSLGLYEISGRD